jgi:hypothetical protein
MALPKGSGSARIRAEFGNILESTRTALLWMSGQDVMGQREVKIRLAGQMSIFNAEAQAQSSQEDGEWANAY